MKLLNRTFTDSRGGEPSAGVLVLPLETPYFARLVHTTFRNLSAPHRQAKRMHVHDVYHILLVTGGRGSFVIGGRSYLAAPGKLFITSPGEWHSFGNGEGETADYCEATFEFKTRRGEVLALPFHRVLSAWVGRECASAGHSADAGPELHGLIVREVERMVRIGFGQEPDYALYLNESLARIFLGLYTHLYGVPPRAVADPLQAVREHIHKHYRAHLSLQQLAELAGVTPNYVSRRFKELYGATPIVYQHRLRVQAAANLLKTTEYPIKQVAQLAGFSDVYFFSRIFKKHQRLPPGRYRASAQRGA